MNNLNARRKENGVGLIEILIVLVVLVIGWAAIAALQGKLISGSSASKARNEALGLAREKTEELRNSIEKGQYVSDLLNTGGMSAPESITGVKATFNRSWLLADLPDEDLPDGTAVGSLKDVIKDVIVKVSWENNEGGPEDVVLNSIIAFSDALKMASLLTGGSGDVGRLASPNSRTATEGPVSEGIGIVSGTLDEKGDTDLDDIYTGKDADDNLVVYQGTPIAKIKLTVFGGKILKFSGLIYYNSSDPFVRATSPSYCTTFTKTQEDCGIQSNGSKIECARYVCYAGGDCSNGGDGCVGDLDKLPDNLNGGWQGKIGNFFPSLANPQKFPVICMGDSDDVAARLFYSERELETGGYEREGINTSFECYDTLISTEKRTGCTKLIKELTRDGIEIDPDADQIADHQIIRHLGVDDTNMVLAVINYEYSTDALKNFCPPPP